MKTRKSKAVLRVLVAVLIGAGITPFFGGCDDPSESARPTTRPAVASATTQPAEQPAVAVVPSYPARPPAIFTIDGSDIAFPAARLAVIGHRGGIVLRLGSDDPPTAIAPGYAGNSFILDMRLPIDRIDELPAAAWDHRPSDADDSISGIFIQGYRDRLRPYDVHVNFQKTDEDTLVLVNGTFLRDDPQNPAGPPEHVRVSGVLHVNGIGE